MSTGLLVPSVTQSAITTTMLSTDTAVVDASPYSLSIPPESSQLRAATQFGLAAPHYEEIDPVPPVCRTGNCQFPRFTTLAICYRVINVTDRLSFDSSGFMDKEQSGRELGPLPSFDSWSHDVSSQFDGDSWNYSRKASLQTGGQLIGGPRYFSMSISYSTVSDSFSRMPPSRWNHRGMFSPTLTLGNNPKLLESGILNFYVIWLNQAYFEIIPTPNNINRSKTLPTLSDQYFDQSFRAVEVLLHFCVKRVNTKVSNGSPKTDMLDIRGTSQLFRVQDGQAKIYNMTTDDKIAPETFSVDEDSFTSLFYYLRGKIRGTFSFWLNPFWTVRGQTPSSEIFGDALWSNDMNGGLNGSGSLGQEPGGYWSITEQDVSQDSKIRRKVQNIADSLTNMSVFLDIAHDGRG